jgi:putative resolvase
VERVRGRAEAGDPDERRALLFVRVRREAEQHLADRALVHLTQWALGQGYAVADVVREVGPGVNGQRDGLERVRRSVRDGAADVVIIERRDRLMLAGAGEFIRWAEENGAAIQEAGLSGERACQAYTEEILEDVFYPLADALALAVGDQERAEQAAARAMNEIADFLMLEE